MPESKRYTAASSGCRRPPRGSYTFCVGDRSGTLRYLFNAVTNCQRGETKLVLPQVEPITICVSERSRTARYVEQGGGQRGEPVYVVINPVG